MAFTLLGTGGARGAGGGPGSGLWTPANISSDPIVWWDPSDTGNRTVVSTTHLSVLADKFGNGNDLSSSVDANRPIIAAANQNGLDTFSCDAVAQQFIGNQTLSIASAGINHTLVCVMKVQSYAARKTPYFTAGTGIANQSYLTIATTPALAAYIWADNGIASYATSDTTNFHIIRATFTTTKRELFVDGLSVASETTTVGENRTLIWLLLGTDTSRYGNVEFGEGVVFVGTDNTDGQKSEGFLSPKWGITLDAGHPYFTAPPTDSGGYLTDDSSNILTDDSSNRLVAT